MAKNAGREMLPEVKEGGKPTYFTLNLSPETKARFEAAQATLKAIREKAEKEVNARYEAPAGHTIVIFSQWGQWKFAAVPEKAKSGKGEAVTFSI